jgi:predicted short-subunit dehydrogenase-like oxidoreductase (DUF2520 family)
LIGAGKVAWHLGHVLHSSGWKVIQVYNRSNVSGQTLANKLDVPFTAEPGLIRDDAEVYIVCLSDNALSDLTDWWPHPDKLLVHVSGSQPIEILSRASSRQGVFYPLQTFGNKEDDIKFSSVPVCIEASGESDLNLLRQMALSISCCVEEMDSQTRLKLHLAAVMANNFTNFILSLAMDYCSLNNLDSRLLIPLIKQTFVHLPQGNPFLRQTGPAVRGDEIIIRKHQQLLDSYPMQREVYRFLTECIIKFKKNHGKL